MTKEYKKTYIITTIVCLIPIVVGVILYPQIPDRIITHWDAYGNPDGYSNKFVGLFVLPGGILLLNLLFPFLLKIDPKYDNVSDKVKKLTQWIIPIIMVFASGLTIASAINIDLKVKIMAPAFLGLLFVLIGNYMPKMSQSYTVGIKIPWTLDDEDNWNRTHRLAGYLWVACGILVFVCALLQCEFIIYILIFVIMLFVPVIYSFILFLKKK